MPAYDMQERQRSARLTRVLASAPRTTQNGSFDEPAESNAGESIGSRANNEVEPIVDALLDRLADRVVAAVVARLSNEPDHQAEWLDSREAAEYLGLHRDTLRRLAAARAIPAEQGGRGCKLYFRPAALDDWRRSGGRSRHLAAVADAA